MRFRSLSGIRWLAWLALGLALLAIAWWLLGRVAAGWLFLLAIAVDYPATAGEIVDARESAQYYFVPAVACVAATTSVLAWAMRRGVRASAALARRAIAVLVNDHRVPVGLFLAATFADLVTTLWFVHHAGLEFEVHPGIRLFGYALGRTAGPVLGKALQCAGIVLLAALLPRLARPILIVAIAICAAATAVNGVSNTWPDSSAITGHPFGGREASG